MQADFFLPAFIGALFVALNYVTRGPNLASRVFHPWRSFFIELVAMLVTAASLGIIAAFFIITMNSWAYILAVDPFWFIIISLVPILIITRILASK